MPKGRPTKGIGTAGPIRNILKFLEELKLVMVKFV